MPETRRMPYPQAAVEWMLPDPARRVLDLGSGDGAFARMLDQAGHETFCVDRSPAAARHVADRRTDGRQLIARAEALPLADQQFDAVSAAESLHKFAPGLAFAEIARVLRPGGRLIVVYNTRDDTVPWVKKLAAILRAVDPTAMRGDFGQRSTDELAASPYFSNLEQRKFRNWIPIDRPGLLNMVSSRPETENLDDTETQRVLTEVGKLYDEYARAPEPLMLPFQASCWRATVDHRELTISESDDDGLDIPLGF